MLDGYLAGIRPQLAQFLDLSDGLLLDNSAWLGELSTLDFLRDVGKHFTVNQMVGKESVKSRFERPDQGISYTEFSYMLLQAYDFLHLHSHHACDLQIGGSDQWGNITMGVELVRKVCQDEVWGLTTPLVVKADGTKLGKTESGNVWLERGAHQPFRPLPVLPQHARCDGRCVPPLLHLLVPRGDRGARCRDVGAAPTPRRPRALARAVVSLVHGEAEATKCENASEALFTEEIASLSEDMLLAVTEDAPSTDIARQSITDGLSLVDALSAVDWPSPEATPAARSRAAGRTSTTSNNPMWPGVLGPDDLLHDRYIVLRKGRHDVHVLRAATE